MTLRGLIGQIQVLAQAAESGFFVPILEADVVAFLYHLLLSSSSCGSAVVHVDTRVSGSGPSEKFDLVIGELSPSLEAVRPVVVPQFVIEVKVFLSGFTTKQHRIRYQQILSRDLRKLAGFAKAGSHPTLVEFIFDEVEYLSGGYKEENRLDYLLSHRDTQAPDARIIVASRKSQFNSWEVKQY